MAHQHSFTCGWGEGYCRLKLGVIVSTRALVEIGPRKIEYIFAVGMALHIKRRTGGYISDPVFEYEMVGHPARLRSHRAAVLQSLKEGIRDEGVVDSGAGIPVMG